MLTDHRLALIRVKVERAYKHIDDLEDAVRPFLGQAIKTISFNRDSKVGNVGMQVTDLHIYDFAVTAIAGDVVHNLRSALDHLAFQLVEVGIARGELREHGWEKIQFPIENGLDGYKSIKPRKVEGMTREAIEAIDALQPYKGGNHALWVLRQLDNADKHKSIITVGGDFILGGIAFNDSDPYFTALNVPDDEQDVDFPIDESTIKMKVSNSNALLPTLHQIADFVSYIVTAFAPLLYDGTPQMQARVAGDATVDDFRKLYTDDDTFS